MKVRPRATQRSSTGGRNARVSSQTKLLCANPILSAIRIGLLSNELAAEHDELFDDIHLPVAALSSWISRRSILREGTRKSLLRSDLEVALCSWGLKLTTTQPRRKRLNYYRRLRPNNGNHIEASRFRFFVWFWIAVFGWVLSDFVKHMTSTTKSVSSPTTMAISNLLSASGISSMSSSPF
jgi:hypothetical protein